jgi:hypothetical protein
MRRRSTGRIYALFLRIGGSWRFWYVEGVTVPHADEIANHKHRVIP